MLLITVINQIGLDCVVDGDFVSMRVLTLTSVD
jgi:hypothetical protein